MDASDMENAMKITLPMTEYAEWRKTHRGVRVYFRGPRVLRTRYQWNSGKADCLKENATHFIYYEYNQINIP